MTTTNKTISTAEEMKFIAEARKFNAEAQRAELEASGYAITVAREKKKDIERDAMNDERNIYHFFGEVHDISAYTFMRAMERFARVSPEKDIEVLFTSPGGSILAGLAIVDHVAQIRRQYGVKVTTVALGMAASMAGILMQSGDRRVMGRESWLLIHEASFMTGGSFGEVMDTVDWVKQIQDRIVDLFLARTDKITKAQFQRSWKRKDWWLSSDKALELGFIDEVR